MSSPMLSLKQRLANLSQQASASGTSGPFSPTSFQSSSSLHLNTSAGAQGENMDSPTTPTQRRIGSGAKLGSAFGAAINNIGNIGKKKAPWLRTGGNEGPGQLRTGNGDLDKVDEVLSRMVFQAGVDNETRPMVIMNASAFPDPRVISYDHLLSRILSYLDLFVESDYSVVFFAAGGHYTPSWNWVWKAYRSLSRKYRKNLKRLYIVHSSFFSKMLFSLAGAIISPKFFRKITYIDSLSVLASHVPLTQIDIPPAVYAENLKYESQICLPMPIKSQMFGVPLDAIMGYEGEKDGLPRVVRDCIQYLRETGLEEDGLFRRSPNSAQLRQVREAYNRGQTVSLQHFGDPHLAAVLLKKFLRDLPEPIFPERLYDIIRRCPPIRDEVHDMAAIMYVRSTILPELAPCVQILLSNVLLLLHEVSLRSDVNRMDAHNLAIVITPNLVASGNPLRDVAICAVAGGPEPLSPGAVPRGISALVGPEDAARGKTTLGTLIKLCIHRYFEVFDEMADRAESLDADPFSLGESDDQETEPQLSSASSSPVARRQSLLHDDDSIDDAMLVMPIGPSGSNSHQSGDTRANAVGSGSVGKVRARSLFAVAEKDGNGVPTSGTVAIPKSASASSTLRKSTGAGVSAYSVTATGFFTPPASGGSSPSTPAPPVPPARPLSKTPKHD